MHHKSNTLAVRAPILFAVLALAGCLSGQTGGGDSAATSGSSIETTATAPATEESGGSTTPSRSLVKSTPSSTPVSVTASTVVKQSAPAGNPVTVAPAILVKDAKGMPVSGVDITFMVISGGGFVSEPTATSDTAGIARVGGWTLGAAPGLNQMVGRSSGLPEVTFYATGTPVAGQGSLTPVTSTDNQAAVAGAMLPGSPQVIVRNSSGVPQSGVSVSFTVASGGGTIQNATATTTASGIASAGRWTLGSAIGTQTLNVSAAGYASIQIRATALATGTPGFTRQVVMRGLQNPWDLAFPPEGGMLYTEINRGLSVRLANGTVRSLFKPADLVGGEQCGMLGLALDPQFATNRTLYVYMASSAGGAPDNRVVSLVVDATFTGVSNRRDIVTGISHSAGVHCGGRLRFGPDGYLYVTTGDTRQGPVPQSLQHLGGKVLRVDRDGNPAAGNGTPAGGNPRIFAYGFRNVQGIDFRPATNVPFIAEHGPGYSDEVTPLRPGGNGGWDPYCAQGSEHGVQYCGYDGTTQMTDSTRFPGAMLPVWADNGLSEGMAGNAFLKGAAWRDWHGAMAVAMLAGRRLEILRFDPAGVTATSTPILNTYNVRLRSPVLAPDGTLYITTDNNATGDEIWRLVPN